MKLALIYCSVHHGNTKQLADAVGRAYPDALIIDASKVLLKDLLEYDLIGVASGIYFGKMHKSVMKFLEDNFPEGKRAFIMYTSGASANNLGTDAEKMIAQKKGILVGKYACRGYDTFGPFKLVGGLQKGHPTADEINGAVDFVKRLETGIFH